MKIAYLCSDRDVPVLGSEGSSIHVREVTGALARAGHEVFIIASWLGGRPAPEFTVPCYELKPEGLDEIAWRHLEHEPLVHNNNLYRDLSSVLYNSVLETAGASLLGPEKPDFIYERYSLFGWAGAQLSRQLGIPLILEVNTPLCQEQDGYNLFTLTHTARQMEIQILQSADVIVAVSNWLKDWIIAQGASASKVHVIPNGVSNLLFSSPVSGDAIRQRYDLAGNRVIGLVTSFQPWQDVDGLIDAFSELHGADPDVRLLLVGEGEGKHLAQQRVASSRLSDVALFTGAVPHDEIPAYISAMDVTVAPSVPWHPYGSPMKLCEYLAIGKPTVVADVGEIHSIVTHCENGWLYPPSDREALLNGLRVCLYDTALATRIGQAARQTILKEYTWESIVERIVSLAGAVIHDRGKQ